MVIWYGNIAPALVLYQRLRQLMPKALQVGCFCCGVAWPGCVLRGVKLHQGPSGYENQRLRQLHSATAKVLQLIESIVCLVHLMYVVASEPSGNEIQRLRQLWTASAEILN